jgi:FixJ family two-component response regulator
MNEASSAVFVIDDDPSIRHALGSLVQSVGLHAEVFASTREFRQAKRPPVPSCLILDVRLPGTSGLDFQRELKEAGIRIPIVFITAYADVRMAVDAMKAGAVEFLTKPLRDQDILDAIHEALERDRERLRRDQEVQGLQRRLELLTPRERQILPLVVSGLLNKEVAGKIGTSEAAAKVHRSQMMRKMGANSIAELVRMAVKLGFGALGAV